MCRHFRLQKYTKAPLELQQQAQLNAEIVISEEAEKDQQRVGASEEPPRCEPCDDEASPVPERRLRH